MEPCQGNTASSTARLTASAITDAQHIPQLQHKDSVDEATYVLKVEWNLRTKYLKDSDDRRSRPKQLRVDKAAEHRSTNVKSFSTIFQKKNYWFWNCGHTFRRSFDIFFRLSVRFWLVFIQDWFLFGFVKLSSYFPLIKNPKYYYIFVLKNGFF